MIKDRIQRCDLTEGQDFSPILAKSTGGRPSTEYALSLNMAKERSMLERNDKGKQARQNYIECEKALRTNRSMPKLGDTLPGEQGSSCDKGRVEAAA